MATKCLPDFQIYNYKTPLPRTVRSQDRVVELSRVWITSSTQGLQVPKSTPAGREYLLIISSMANKLALLTITQCHLELASVETTMVRVVRTQESEALPSTLKDLTACNITNLVASSWKTLSPQEWKLDSHPDHQVSEGQLASTLLLITTQVEVSKWEVSLAGQSKQLTITDLAWEDTLVTAAVDQLERQDPWMIQDSHQITLSMPKEPAFTTPSTLLEANQTVVETQVTVTIITKERHQPTERGDLTTAVEILVSKANLKVWALTPARTKIQLNQTTIRIDNKPEAQDLDRDHREIRMVTTHYPL